MLSNWTCQIFERLMRLGQACQSGSTTNPKFGQGTAGYGSVDTKLDEEPVDIRAFTSCSCGDERHWGARELNQPIDENFLGERKRKKPK
jgi:hypothetical protein